MKRVSTLVKYILLIISVFFFINIHCQEGIRMLSWNIQNLGRTKSTSEIEQIAAILNPYDLVAIQEVVAIDPAGAQAVARLVDELNRKGEKWDYVVSNPTRSKGKRKERYAFLWKPHRVKVLWRGALVKDLQKKITREPFLLEIQWNEQHVYLCNYHSRNYKENPEKEIAVLIDFILAKKKTCILLGDFNTFSNHPVFTKLYDSNYTAAVKDIKTTLKYSCWHKNYLSVAIDNIFYPYQSFTLVSSGVLDFVGGCENLKLARKISDHLPVVAHLKKIN